MLAVDRLRNGVGCRGVTFSQKKKGELESVYYEGISVQPSTQPHSHTAPSTSVDIHLVMGRAAAEERLRVRATANMVEVGHSLIFAYTPSLTHHTIACLPSRRSWEIFRCNTDCKVRQTSLS